MRVSSLLETCCVHIKDHFGCEYDSKTCMEYSETYYSAVVTD